MSVTPELEAMARAIFEVDHEGINRTWAAAIKASRETYMAFARAALLAIREPSEEAYCALAERFDFGPHGSPSSPWPDAMIGAYIDHILSNPDQGEDA